jgi:hypothetical protein
VELRTALSFLLFQRHFISGDGRAAAARKQISIRDREIRFPSEGLYLSNYFVVVTVLVH